MNNPVSNRLDTTISRAIGAPLIAFDWLSDRARHLMDETRGRTAEAVSASRRAARAGLDEVREKQSDQDSRPYELRTADELYDLARDRDIDGRSTMTKDELIEALRNER